ncbi:hypothetical protein SAY87_001812 [Trapa incisa]|uniref:Uncharacterized protein n=1 Tax=Trapa incisa TaxID=236973 RepID=A0AAN7PU31_9MYRT|nr:hypothetical protein SAY87_001812 [Trapa incisa]
MNSLIKISNENKETGTSHCYWTPWTVWNFPPRKDDDQELDEMILFVKEASNKVTDKAEGSAESSAASGAMLDSTKSVHMIWRRRHSILEMSQFYLCSWYYWQMGGESLTEGLLQCLFFVYIL